jgi:hypothetical protein
VPTAAFCRFRRAAAQKPFKSYSPFKLKKGTYYYLPVLLPYVRVGPQKTPKFFRKGRVENLFVNKRFSTRNKKNSLSVNTA